MPIIAIHDYRNFFPSPKELPSQDKLLEKIHIAQYLDKTEDFYHLNLTSTQKALMDLSYITKLDDPDLKGIAWAGLGAIHTFNGDYRSAYAAFHLALDQTVTDDVQAYRLLELSNLIRKLGYRKEAEHILKTALELTDKEKLVWRIKTYLGLCYKHNKPYKALGILKDSEKHYRDENDYIRLSCTVRHIGQVYSRLKDYQKAHAVLNEALGIAEQHQLTKHSNEATNDLGWLMILQKKYDQARTIFNKLLERDLPPYHLSLALQNLGYLEFECKNYRKSITYHSQSLRLTSRYGMLDMLIEDYYKLGLCHEKLGEVGLADHFYSLGYQETEKDVALRLPLLGYRKTLLDNYLRFLRDNQQTTAIELDDEIFHFALGKTLKEIRNIFHTHYLNLHISRSKSAAELCRKIGIDTKTYFTYQKRLGLRRGVKRKTALDRNIHFKRYLESLARLSWREANKQFESDMLAYLLKAYQNNKKRLAQDLGISYIYIIKLTN